MMTTSFFRLWRQTHSLSSLQVVELSGFVSLVDVSVLVKAKSVRWALGMR